MAKENKEQKLPASVVTPYGNYTLYEGDETTVPSMSTYLDTRANEARIKAVGNMLNLEHPTVPEVPSKLSSASIKLGLPEDIAMMLFGKSKHPHTCIKNTTESHNDRDVVVPGNKTFANNHKGYIEVDKNDGKPGDILNIYDENNIPYHSTLITGGSAPNYRITYSNGGIDSEDGRSIVEKLMGVAPYPVRSMRYDKDNLYDDGNPDTPDFKLNKENPNFKIYRYMGSPSMRKQWSRDYVNMFGTPGTKNFLWIK